jgi:acetyl esterase/lipase
MKSGIYIGEVTMKKTISILVALVSISILCGCVNIVTFDRENKLNLIYAVPSTPKPPKGYPAIVLIHGFGGTKEKLIDIAISAAEHGYFAITIDWRDPDVAKLMWPAQLDDIKNAIAWLVKDTSHAAKWSMLNLYNIDPERIGAVGLSGGGTLALRMMELDDPHIKAIVSLAGPTNLETEYRYLAFGKKEDPSDPLPFTPFVNTEIIKFCNELLGPYEMEDVNNDGKPDYDPFYFEESPINHINANVSLLFLQGNMDNLVPLSQSRSLMGKMRGMGGICDLIIYKFGHSFDPGFLTSSCPIDEMDVNSGIEYTSSKKTTGQDIMFEFFQAKL